MVKKMQNLFKDIKIKLAILCHKGNDASNMFPYNFVGENNKLMIL